MEGSLHSRAERARASQFDSPAPAGAGRLEIKHSGDGLVMASMGPISVALWRTKPTRLLFEIQRNELAKVVSAHRGSAAFMCIVQEGTADPDDELRKASAEMITGHGTSLAAVACVIEGSGFRAAITRTVLTGILFLARNPAPTRFVESVQAAATWIGTRIGKPHVAGLVEAVASMRASR
jgi:hypothetical protein